MCLCYTQERNEVFYIIYLNVKKYNTYEKFSQQEEICNLKEYHDQIFNLFKDKFEAMPCFEKYGNYTNSDNLPKFVREALTKK